MRMSKDADKTYTVHPITEDDVSDVMDLLKRTFYIHEPLNEAIDLWSEDRPCSELDDYCRQSLLEGLSFKAVDRQGNIVGVTISGVQTFTQEDSNQLLEAAHNCKNPKFQKILYILAQREQQARLWEKFPEHQKLVEVKVAATDPNWGRRGIMSKLIEETAKATKALGITLLRLDTSSAYSAKAADRRGFTLVYKALYTDIKRGGQPLIVPKPPHLDDRVYIKVLT